jgi:hypothetical protein
MILEPILGLLVVTVEESHDAFVQQWARRGLGSSTIENALKCTDNICQVGNDRVKVNEHHRG